MLLYVIPIYNILINKLEDFCDTSDRFEDGKEAANKVINKLQEYYNKTDTTLYSTFLTTLWVALVIQHEVPNE
ncbi:hypothetical protein C1645_812093 [Glomus cerebriforme]|uniref:Uncharacterized protein n=1 Tax=Glomus cerebriforme TaxID=658196 RepID=A0A397TL10_9GLOM|nr:hypothetical protein C1645_812093 [Glomus cerebriforme]